MSAATTPLEALVKARELLSDPAHWARGVMARNAEGDEVWAGADTATCWCAMGALGRVCPSIEARGPALHLLALSVGDCDIADFNDDSDTTHANLMAAFDHAIELAKEEQP